MCGRQRSLAMEMEVVDDGATGPSRLGYYNLWWPIGAPRSGRPTPATRIWSAIPEAGRSIPEPGRPIPEHCRQHPNPVGPPPNPVGPPPNPVGPPPNPIGPPPNPVGEYPNTYIVGQCPNLVGQHPNLVGSTGTFSLGTRLFAHVREESGTETTERCRQLPQPGQP